MTTMKKLAAGAATTVLAMAVMTGAALAQETTGGINGTAKGPGGAPLANAPVTVVYGPTNQTFTTTTDSRGLFSIRQLPPGGPYTVRVGDLTSKVDTVDLGAPTVVDIAPEAAAGTAGTAVSEVTVTASRAGPQTVQTGPRSTFNATDVETLPSFSRDLRDIARLNPFVQIDPTNQQALIIAGTNNRFNAIYVDGVRESDDFGLNANGYPTQRSPISIDLVQALNVEVAPYDVAYGAFQGGVLNITTKSGSNEFHGSASYEYDSDHFASGKEIRDVYRNLPFQDKDYSFTLSGPIIKDKVFFAFGYEKYEGLTSTSYGPSDAVGVTNPVSGTTTAQVQQIQQILQSRYGYAAGGFGVTQPIESTKYFGKLTWQITDKQRFVFEAQSTDDTNFNQPDDSATRLGLVSTQYVFEQPLESYSGYLYSNWTSRLSTELSYTHRETDGITNNLGAAGPHFNVFLNGVASGTDIEAGPDISRQANLLLTTDQLLRAKANYTWGAHTFTAGYERDQIDIFNVFVQNATGAYDFTSIANLASGTATALRYANAASNNPNDGAAVWGDTIHTGYLQDEWRPLSNLTIRGGVRIEYYEQSDKPKANPLFQQLYGFSNTANLDGDVVVMPRIGFNYRPLHNLVINGGVGLFSGGNPNVWISNNYSNTGNILGSVSCNTSGNCGTALTNVTGSAIPTNVQQLNTASANLGTGVTNALDPNFDPPSVWKASIAAAYTLNFSEFPFLGRAGSFLGDGWRLHADYLYQTVQDAVLWQDLQTLNKAVGTAPDGRPIFQANHALPAGRTATYDLILTNTHKGHGEIYAIGGGKTFENGIDFDVTYTHTDTKDVNPGTSSVALSNYVQLAFSDPNNPKLSTSNYSIPDSVKLNFGYSHNFFGDYATRLRIYAQRRSGLPYSFTFNGTNGTGANTTDTYGLVNTIGGTRNNELFYVPAADGTGNVTLTSDPKVRYAAGFDITSFNAYLKASGLSQYSGSISPRNAFNSRSVSQIDLQFTQEIPAFFPTKAKAELYFQIFNLGNLINNSWGVVDQIGFPYFSTVVTNAIVACGAASGCAPGQTNQYIYSPVSGRTTGFGQTPTINTGSSGQPPTSTWALKVGVRYKF